MAATVKKPAEHGLALTVFQRTINKSKPINMTHAPKQLSKAREASVASPASIGVIVIPPGKANVW